MTTNQTIDGVPRAVIAAFAKVADSYSEAEDDSYEPWQDAMMHAELRLTLGQFRELRALLDADECCHEFVPFQANCTKCGIPYKQAAQPQGEPVAWRYHDDAGSSPWFNGAPDQINLEFVERRGGRVERSFAEQPAPVAEQLIERLAQRFPDLENMYTAAVFADWLRAELNTK